MIRLLLNIALILALQRVAQALQAAVLRWHTSKAQATSVGAKTSVYQVVTTLRTYQAEQRWSLLYYYLVATTILIAAWSTLFISETLGESAKYLEAVLSAGGFLFSVGWCFLMVRMDFYVQWWQARGQEVEAELWPIAGFTSAVKLPFKDTPLTRQTPQVVAWPDKRPMNLFQRLAVRNAYSGWVALLVPLAFVGIFSYMAWLTLTIERHPLSGLGSLPEMGSATRAPCVVAVVRESGSTISIITCPNSAPTSTGLESPTPTPTSMPTPATTPTDPAPPDTPTATQS